MLIPQELQLSLYYRNQKFHHETNCKGEEYQEKFEELV